MTHPEQLATDTAIDAAEAAADTAWFLAALDAVKWCAETLFTLTTDDVWTRLENTYDGDPPREPRALGAVMRRARAEGWIEPTADYDTSERRGCHMRPVRIWRCLARAVDVV